jgi:hypothetical protein
MFEIFENYFSQNTIFFVKEIKSFEMLWFFSFIFIFRMKSSNLIYYLAHMCCP